MKERIATVLLTFVAAVVLIACCAGCQGPGGSANAGVVASVQVGTPGAKPSALVRYDANVFVAWGSNAYVGEVFIQATGLPLYIYVGAASTAVVRVAKPNFKWQGAVGDVLPAEAMPMFRPAEIEAWGLVFMLPTVNP